MSNSTKAEKKNVCEISHQNNNVCHISKKGDKKMSSVKYNGKCHKSG